MFELDRCTNQEISDELKRIRMILAPQILNIRQIEVLQQAEKRLTRKD